VLRIRADTQRSQCEQALMLVASTCFSAERFDQARIFRLPGTPAAPQLLPATHARSTKAACSQLELCVAVH